MAKLSESFRNIFKIQELRQRILFTGGLLVVVRFGAHVTIPGVDAKVLSEVMRNQTSNTLFGLYDLFVGGAFSNAAIFALGIMPYISSSIIIQLLGAVIPYFQKLSKEGEEGRKKITQWTRYGTVVISLLQAWGVSVQISSMSPAGTPIVPAGVQGFGFHVSTMIILTAGTIFIMWLGEQITERGIGNGISLIIFIGIIARFPNDIVQTISAIQNGTVNWILLLAVLAIMILVVAVVVMMTQAQRKVPVQYAKRVVGRKTYGGQNKDISLKVHNARVIPIIFCPFPITLPASVAHPFPESGFLGQRC